MVFYTRCKQVLLLLLLLFFKKQKQNKNRKKLKEMLPFTDT